MNHCVQQSFLAVVKLCRLPRKLDEQINKPKFANSSVEIKVRRRPPSLPCGMSCCPTSDLLLARLLNVLDASHRCGKYATAGASNYILRLHSLTFKSCALNYLTPRISRDDKFLKRCFHAWTRRCYSSVSASISKVAALGGLSRASWHLFWDVSRAQLPFNAKSQFKCV